MLFLGLGALGAYFGVGGAGAWHSLAAATDAAAG